MKSNQNHQRIAEAFDRLFRTYPQFGQGSTPEEIARDRVEKAKVYFDAVAMYDEQDVEQSVDAFLSGTAPGVNPNYAPPAPVVASECRRQMNLRLDRQRDRRPALPPPDIEHTPEERIRVKAMVDATVAKLSSTLRTDDAERERSRKAQLSKTNARFQPDMSDDAMRERLLKRDPWAVGDPENDRDVA